MDQHLREGIALFNAARFWEAHEAWERIWLRSTGDEKRFVQGLIQLAAAYHHVGRGTYAGALRLFDAALQKLDGYPEDYLGIARGDAVVAAAKHRQKIVRDEVVIARDYPTLMFW